MTRLGRASYPTQLLVRKMHQRINRELQSDRRHLVAVADEQHRKKLMIIYAEDLAPTGYSVADLARGGRAEAEWPRLEKALLQRAMERIKGR